MSSGSKTVWLFYCVEAIGEFGVLRGQKIAQLQFVAVSISTR